MILAIPYWSLWIRVPAYIVGVIIFGGLWLYGLSLLADTDHSGEIKRSNWLGCVLIALAIIAIPAYIAAWYEKRVVAAFAEWLVAQTVFYVAPIGGAAVGYFIGHKVNKNTSQQWLGWVVGILIGLAVAVCVMGACSKIPGIGWRMERISEQLEEADDGY